MAAASVFGVRRQINAVAGDVASEKPLLTLLAIALFLSQVVLPKLLKEWLTDELEHI